MIKEKEKLISLIISILSLIVTTVGVVFAFYINETANQVQSNIQNVERDIKVKKFTITYPSVNDSVDITDFIHGKTPYRHLKHYIIVTVVKSGEAWIQPGGVTVNSSGSWIGQAKFSEAGNRKGEKFIVHAIATDSRLTPGPLTKVPENAVTSDHIIVIRK